MRQSPLCSYYMSQMVLIITIAAKQSLSDLKLKVYFSTCFLSKIYYTVYVLCLIWIHYTCPSSVRYLNILAIDLASLSHPLKIQRHPAPHNHCVVCSKLSSSCESVDNINWFTQYFTQYLWWWWYPHGTHFKQQLNWKLLAYTLSPGQSWWYIIMRNLPDN